MGQRWDKFRASVKADRTARDAGEQEIIDANKEALRWQQIESCQECLERATLLISSAIRKELGIPAADTLFHVNLKISPEEENQKFGVQIVEEVLRYKKARGQTASPEEKARFSRVKEFLDQLDTVPGFQPFWKTEHKRVTGRTERKTEENGCSYLQENYFFARIETLIKGLNTRLSADNQIDPESIIAPGEHSRRLKFNRYGTDVIER